jgi:hypothetical protein
MMLRSKIWHSALALAVATPALLPASPAHAAKDQAVCYKVDSSNDRIVLDVKKHSDLTTFGLKQTVYDALGKHTQNFGYKQSDNYMAVAHGAVVVAKKNIYQPLFRSGAHMGLVSEWVRTVSSPSAKRPIDWDCTSAEESATPSTWTCNAVGGTLVAGPANAVTLYKVAYASKDPYCGIFQDGEAYAPPPY